MRTKIAKSRLVITGLVLLSLLTAACNKPGGNNSWLLMLLLGKKSPSSEARLKTLGVQEGTAFTFNSKKTGLYVSTVPKTTTDITILVAPMNLKATVAIDGTPVTGGSFNTPFTDDEHTYSIVVTALNKSTTLKYQLTVRRDKSHEARLDNLTVSAGSLIPGFDSGLFAYADSVPFGTSSIDITATLMDTSASLTIDGNPAASGSASAINISTLPADNSTQRSVTVAITAEDGTTTRDYVIALTRQCEDPLDCPPADPAEDRLSALSVQDGTAFTFNTDNTGPYESTVARDKTTVIITAIPVSSKATVTIDTAPVAGTSLEVAFTGTEQQTYAIHVTSKDASQSRTYQLIVKREKSSEARLFALAISAGTLTPAFGGDTHAYAAQVPYDTTSLGVTPTVMDANATMTVDGITTASGSTAAIDISALPADGTTTQNVVVAVTAQNGTTVLFNTITLTKRLAPCNNDARLSGLTVSEGSLNPTFASGVFTYALSIADTSTTLTVTPTSICPDASITVESLSVSSGDGVAVDVTTTPKLITIIVTDPTTTQQTYTINVTKEGYTEARLSSLSTSEGTLTPVFDTDEYSYNNVVDFGATSINVTAVPMESGATLTIDGVAATSGAASTVDLPLATKDIMVDIEAEDHVTHKQYIIHVSKGLNPENRLSGLTVSAGSLNPAFALDTVTYTDQVPYGTTSVNVTATVMDAGATLTIDGAAATSGAASTVSLPDPTKNIDIVVTAQSGATRTYTIEMTKAQDSENQLSNLVVSLGTLSPAFDTGTQSYSDLVPFGTTSMTVTATRAGGNSTLTIDGAASTSGVATSVSLLNPTKTITIVVTAQNGSARIYTIDVAKEQDPENRLTDLAVSAGTLSPAFSSGTNAYTDQVPFGTPSINVTATVMSANATLTIDGVTATSGAASSVSLPDPTKTINVVVTAQNGSTRAYTIDISKAQDPENRLSNLAVSAGTLSPAFESGTNGYTDQVPYGTTSVNVTATVMSANSTITIDGLAATSGAASAVSLPNPTKSINIVVTAQSGATRTYTIDVSKALNPENRLNNLTVSAGTLAPAFASGTNLYSDQLPFGTASINVTATVMSSDSTITIDGVAATSGSASTVSLPDPTKTINIVVTAQNGSNRTYSISIAKDLDPENRLSALAISAGTYAPAFNSNTTAYTTSTLPYNTTSIDVTATRISGNSSITIDGAAATSGVASTVSLPDQTKTINMVVTAQNGTARTYTLNVTKDAPPSNEGRLSGLSMSAGTLTPVFGADTYTYGNQVPFGSTSVSVTATTMSGNATITIDGVSTPSGFARTVSLPNPTKTIDIVVTAQDLSTKTYTINVTKALDPDNSLSGLSVSAGALNPVFATGTLSYTDVVPYGTASMTVTATQTSANSSITIDGSAATSGSPSTVILLNPTKTINIVVTAQDSTTRTYTIDISKAQDPENHLSNLVVSLGTLTPAFATGTQSYSDIVPYGTTSMTVTATGTSANSTITIDGSAATSGMPSTVSLPGPTKTINVVVIAQDGTTRTYAIDISKAQDPENHLSNLAVSLGTLSPAFATGTQSYTDIVPFGTTSMTVTATRTSANSTITIDGSAATSGTPSTVSLPDPTKTINIVVTAQDGTTRTYAIDISKAQDPENHLSDLAVSLGTLSPAFATGTQSYTDIVPFGTTSMTVTATRTSANSTITIDGSAATSGSPSTVSLPDPNKTINIVVTAQDGTTRTYAIDINKAQDPENHLSNLAVSLGTLSPAFATGTQSYTDTVPFGTTSMTVTATRTSANSTITIDGSAATSGSPSTVSLPDPTKTINIVVTAQDGTTRTYAIDISKAQDPENHLSNLVVSLGTLTPAFATGTQSYSDTVPFGTTSMTVTATRTSANSTITIDGSAATSGTPSTVSLPDPTKTINIVITAQDGTTRTYAIDISKAQDPENHLSNLTVSLGTLTPAFATGTQSYSDIVPFGTTSMTVTATRTSANSTITIDGSAATSGTPSTVSLPDPTKTINIVVTAQDGTTRTYAIDISKAQDPENHLSNLAVSLGTLSPAFATGTQSYTDTVPFGTMSMTVTATRTSANSTITIDGSAATSGTPSTVSLPDPTKTINIVVTAQDGTTRTYAIDISKAQDPENHLSNLAVSMGTLSPAFATGKQSYTDIVPFGTTSMTVTATRTSANSTITIDGSAATSGTPSTVSLPDPTKTINIVVTAQDGTTRTYTIALSKAPDPENHLSAMTVSQGSLNPAFDTAMLSYSDQVPYGTTSMTVMATTASANATLTIDGSPATSGVASTVSLPDPTKTINIVVTAQDGTTRTYAIDISKAQDSENHLSNLVVSLGTLNPAFVSGTQSYSDIVPFGTTSMTVTATRTSTNSTITIDGSPATSGSPSTVSLPDPTKTISIVVTAQDGTTRTYNIDVAKGLDPENHLSNLVVSLGTLSPAFATGTQSYSDVVPYGTTSMTVTATRTGANSTITIDGSAATSGTPSMVSLPDPTKTINIVVTAQDGTTRTYSIDVAKGQDPENHLSNLTVSLGTLSPAFAAATQSYADQVPFGTTSMTVTATRTGANSTITIDGSAATSGTPSMVSLPDPTKTINIVVTAQDGTTRTYTIDVAKGQDPENRLSNLVVSLGALTPAFATGTQSYSDIVPYGTTSMTVTATRTSANSTITIDGSVATSGTPSTVSLPDPTKTINIVVTAQDGTTRTYTIDVAKGQDPENHLSNLTVSLGTLSPAFATGTQSYTDTVPFGTTSMTVTATRTSANSTITIDGSAATSGTPSTVSLPNPTKTINIVITAQDGTTRTYAIDISKAQDPENHLSNLAVSLGTLTPAFATGTQSYTDIVPFGTTSMTVTATRTSANATVTIDGSAATSGTPSTVSLPDPTKTINIVVTAQDGTTRTYTIDVAKGQDPENHLSNLTVSLGTLSPAFATGTQSYTDIVPFGTTSMTVTATRTSANSTITIDGSAATSGTPSTVSLPDPTKTINIVVTAQDGTTRTYAIDISKAQDPENHLSNLALSLGTLSPAFATGTQSYSDIVPFGTTSMTVTATRTSANSTITIDGSAATSGTPNTVSLPDPTKTINIVVTAQDGTTRTYTIDVAKGQDPENHLSNLTVSLGTLSPAFATDTQSYADTVPFGTTSMTVTATRTSANSTITIDGSAATSGTPSTVSLPDPTKTINIMVTAQDGTTRTYTIDISKAQDPENHLSNLTVSLGTLSPAFATGTQSYSDTVPFGTTSMTVTATRTSANSTITIDGSAATSGSPSTVSLPDPTKTINIVVTAQDGTTRTYSIDVAKDLDSENHLSGLTVSIGTLSPAFAAGTQSYSDSVPDGTTSMTVTATRTSANSTITIDGSAATSGSPSTVSLPNPTKTINIVVTAQNGVTRTYVIDVAKTQGDTENRLSALVVSAGLLSPAFASGTYSYSDSVSYCTSSMNVTGTAMSSNAAMTINGSPATSGSPFSVNLSGSTGTITIVVTPQTGSTATYSINWAKGSMPNVDLSALTVKQGANTFKKIYQNGFNSANPGFDASITTYGCVVTGNATATTTSVIIGAMLADTNASMTINGTSVASGGTVTVSSLSPGVTYSIPVVVTGASPDTCVTKTYTLQVRVLNIYEAYYGYYAPVNWKNKTNSWVNPCRDSGEMPARTNNFTGQITGTMSWAVTWKQLLITAYSTMTFTNYNNYSDVTDETVSYHSDVNLVWTTPYDFPFTEDSTVKGFKFNGVMRTESNTSGNGTQTCPSGAMTISTTSDDTIFTFTVNYIIQSKDAVVTNGNGTASDSWSSVTYMGGTKKLKYLADTASKKALSSTYGFPTTPWVKTDFMPSSWVE